MKTKLLVILMIVMIPSLSKSHGNHGPKLFDVGIFGGVISQVINSEKISDKHSEVIYKAELVRMNQQVKLFLYDSSMNLKKLNNFSKEAEGYVISYGNGKREREKFKLEILADKNYQGVFPKAKSKPYAINIIFKEKDIKYFVSFDYLD